MNKEYLTFTNSIHEKNLSLYTYDIFQSWLCFSLQIERGFTRGTLTQTLVE